MVIDPSAWPALDCNAPGPDLELLARYESGANALEPQLIAAAAPGPSANGRWLAACVATLANNRTAAERLLRDLAESTCDQAHYLLTNTVPCVAPASELVPSASPAVLARRATLEDLRSRDATRIAKHVGKGLAFSMTCGNCTDTRPHRTVKPHATAVAHLTAHPPWLLLGCKGRVCTFAVGLMGDHGSRITALRFDARERLVEVSGIGE